jgi:single-stranded-DNA-specific exonuclease
MGDANTALQLLLTDNYEEANYLARSLDDYNKQRQQQEQDILLEAEEQVQSTVDLFRDRAIVLAGDTWHLGVLGIVAGRLADKFYRPVILFGSSKSKEERIGSARSIAGFHLMEALRRCEHCLIDYGGHKMAAGITVACSQLDEFRNQFRAIADEMLAETQLIPSLSVDAELAISDLSLSFLEELEKLAPYGNENPEPIFAARNLTLASTPVLIKEKHLKLRFRSQNNVRIEGMGFGWAEQLEELPIYGENYDILFYPRLNNYQGMSSIELKLKDIRKTNMH